MGDGLTCAIFVHCGELCVKNYASDGTGTFREGGVTDGSLPRPIGDSPECFSFRSWFALHPVDYLRAKDDFKIGSAAVNVGTTYQLLQARFLLCDAASLKELISLSSLCSHISAGNTTPVNSSTPTTRGSQPGRKTLAVAQSDHRVDPRRPPCRYVAGKQRHHQQQ
jgi:hypothetical protein